MKDKYGTTPLMQAAWRGRADMLEALLAFGADKDAQNDNGYTALMRAAIRGNARTVRRRAPPLRETPLMALGLFTLQCFGNFVDAR